ncbi:unnamed protein product [Prunus armeniaca]|uniref:Uncharacterized protein n=1 Tax=Prunus armeniaca TaxID=36596 RepID=A0A6J5XZR2_PRUAR|nr:unnamed protein product [Prunus armeniaca]
MEKLKDWEKMKEVEKRYTHTKSLVPWWGSWTCKELGQWINLKAEEAEKEKGGIKGDWGWRRTPEGFFICYFLIF